MPLFSHLPNDGIRPDKPIFLLRCPIDSLMLELCLVSSAGHLIHSVPLVQVTLPLSAPYAISSLCLWILLPFHIWMSFLVHQPLWRLGVHPWAHMLLGSHAIPGLLIFEEVAVSFFWEEWGYLDSVFLVDLLILEWSFCISPPDPPTFKRVSFVSTSQS